jgi:hypothetical protein
MEHAQNEKMGEYAEQAHEKNVWNEKRRIGKQRRILGGFLLARTAEGIYYT